MITSDAIKLLQSHTDRGTVELCFEDGEISVVKINFVSMEDQDVIFKLISTNKKQKYTQRQNASYLLAPFKDIKSVKILT